MMFADDIVLCSESREEVEEDLERWRFALERRGMKVSRIFVCGNEGEGNDKIAMEGTEINKVYEFKYSGSGINSEGGYSTEVKKQIQADWNGWRKVSRVWTVPPEE